MGDGTAAAVQERLAEENAAKRMLSDLEKLGPEADGFDELFAEFQAAVIEHAEAGDALKR